jgi:hypothetical protein
MSKTKQQLAEELARAGVFVETPTIDAPEPDFSIETVGQDGDLAKLASDEKFMSEPIKIRLATTTDPNATPYAIVTVNDVRNRAVIPRGVPFDVKRCHVEVLARMRETRYTQPVRNMSDPESGNGLIPQHAMVYPFEVLHDPNPRGRAWLERIMSEPAY